MRVRQTGDWAEAKRILMTMRRRLPAAATAALLQEAEYLRGHMVRGLLSGAPGGVPFKPLSPMTLAVRRLLGFGGTKILMVSGTMVGSINVSRVGRGVFVGIRRGTHFRTGKGGSGGDVLNIALLHEKGRTWSVRFTDKQRKLLFAARKQAGLPIGGGGGGGRRKITIPARPFIGPVLNKYGKKNDIRKRFEKRLGVLLRGDLGRV